MRLQDEQGDIDRKEFSRVVINRTYFAFLSFLFLFTMAERAVVPLTMLVQTSGCYNARTRIASPPREEGVCTPVDARVSRP